MKYSKRKIKDKERKRHGNIYCVECKREGKKVDAVWREYGGWCETMCEEHKNLIYEDSDYATEADRQTWMRL